MFKTILIFLAILYIIFPRDLLPDWLIGFGWIDDLLVVYLLWRFFFRGVAATGTGRTSGHRQNTGPQNQENTVHAKTPYEVLNVSPGASPAEIRRAYRTLANKYHPDKVAHLGADFQALAEEKFKEIQAAYDVLKRGFGRS